MMVMMVMTIMRVVVRQVVVGNREVREAGVSRFVLI